MSHEHPIISVVLCTFNRADMLSSVLESLADQSVDRSRYEVIVVNNACTDKTDDVIKAFQAAHPHLSVITLTEPQPGLGHARNAGWKHARGVYVAFLDDDCLAPREWLEKMVYAFRSVVPEPWSVGGPILPVYDAPKPSWFHDEYEHWSWGDHARFLHHGECFFGGNMAFTKSVLEQHGGFEPHMGMSGVHLDMGEETALFQRMWQGGGLACALYYCPEAAMRHRVSAVRMRLSYLLKRAFAEGQASYRLSAPPTWLHRMHGLVRGTVAWFWHSSRALLRTSSDPCWQFWMAEVGRVVAFQAGYLAGHLGLLFKVKAAAR